MYVLECFSAAHEAGCPSALLVPSSEDLFLSGALSWVSHASEVTLALLELSACWQAEAHLCGCGVGQVGVGLVLAELDEAPAAERLLEAAYVSEDLYADH